MLLHCQKEQMLLTVNWMFFLTKWSIHIPHFLVDYYLCLQHSQFLLCFHRIANTALAFSNVLVGIIMRLSFMILKSSKGFCGWISWLFSKFGKIIPKVRTSFSKVLSISDIPETFDKYSCTCPDSSSNEECLIYWIIII